MLSLSVIVYFFAIFFAYVGWQRGWTKELIALSGIMLALFGLYEFDNLIRNVLFGDLPAPQVYFIQATLFCVVVFFAYQTRGLDESKTVGRSRGRRSAAEQRAETQRRALGALAGAGNGYMIAGTLWYLLDNMYRNPLAANQSLPNYALAPRVVLPPANTLAADMIPNLPLYILGSGEGTLLALVVVVLFVVILVII